MPKDSNSIDGRDQQILRRLANIEHKIDSIEQTTAFALRADSERHYDSVRNIFGDKRRCVQVYLAANGSRSVQDIARFLGMNGPNVSRELSFLLEEGLLEIQERVGGETYYCKKPIDKTIRISSLLMRDFDLDKDGLPIIKNR